MLTCDIDPETLKCRRCHARVTRLGIDRNCSCASAPGLGDRFASALDTVGITKDRVEAVFGGPCGCDERQAWMNEAGEKWLGLPPGRD